MRWGFLLLCLASFAHAGNNKVQICINNAIRFPQFFERFSNSIVLYRADDPHFRKTCRTGNLSIRVAERLEDGVYRAVLAFHEVRLEPCGPGAVLAIRACSTNAHVNRAARAKLEFARGTHKVVVAGMGSSTTLELAYPAHAYACNKKWLRNALLPSSRRVLATLLRHGKPRARSFAARLLGLFGSGDEAASRLLRQALHDTDAGVRQEAKRALDRANRGHGRKKK